MRNKNLYYPSSFIELLTYLIKHDNYICGVYCNNKLVGYTTIYYLNKKNIYIIEDTLVLDKYRGRGYQKMMWKSIVNSLPSDNVIFCTVHPENIYSLHNALSVGFKIITYKKIYNNSPRYILKYTTDN